MDKKYSQQNTTQFFKAFKELPVTYELEKVHQLINNPNAMARHWKKSHIKPFNLIIMTNSILIGIALLFFWLSPGKTNKNSNLLDKESRSIQEKSVQLHSGEKVIKPQSLLTTQDESKTNFKLLKLDTVVINFVKESNGVPLFRTVSDLQISARNEKVWPTDTSINGEKYIITLSNKELENLGFMLDETGLYYKNSWNGKMAFFHSRMQSGNGEVTHIIPYLNPFNKKETVTNNDFFPEQISSIIYTPWEVTKEKFILINDTLLPILIKHSQLKYGNDDLILWFTISKNLFNHLPERYRGLQRDFQNAIEYKCLNPNVDLVQYETKKITEGLRFIELSKNELQKLGFEFSQKKIDFGVYNEHNYLGFFLAHNGVGVNLIEDTIVRESNLELVYLTNEYGEQSIKWVKNNEPKDKNTILNIFSNSQYLIPVLLNQKDYPETLEENKIFWFKPSEALFDSLPETISRQLKSEYHYITAETIEEQRKFTTSCTVSFPKVEPFKIRVNSKLRINV